jgi:alkylhydroperoxidase/carboxymuconolactone decarboxylase family protein YurZ
VGRYGAGSGKRQRARWQNAALAYLAYLAALRLESGVPFRVQQAKQRGASRDEGISAILACRRPGTA